MPYSNHVSEPMWSRAPSGSNSRARRSSSMERLGVTMTSRTPNELVNPGAAIMSQNGLHEAHEVVRKASSVSIVPVSATVASGEGTSNKGTFGERSMRIGVLGGTGPAGSGLAARFASVGVEVVVGSRSEDRAAGAVAELTKRWDGISTAISPGSNRQAAEADVVVVSTPWEGAVSTVKDLAPQLAGKIVVSMVNAMARWGDRFIPLLPPTGSVAVAIAEALPQSRVAGAFHHLPAGPLRDPAHQLLADVMVFSDHRNVTDDVIQLVNRIPGLRGIDVGGLGSAMAVEALTAALVEVNRRYKAHVSLQLTGLD
jgi:8-hydroxy-5-deazaflavin:NADPH oxidoreductase